jgi:hypothetical protein
LAGNFLPSKARRKAGFLLFGGYDFGAAAYANWSELKRKTAGLKNPALRLNLKTEKLTLPDSAQARDALRTFS